MHIDVTDKTIDDLSANFITLESFAYIFETSLFRKFFSFFYGFI